MKKYVATFFILACALPCAFATGRPQASAGYSITPRTQAGADADSFTAVVKSDEARFTLPLPRRRGWKWRRPETGDNTQEYRMDVSVKNGGSEYTFGFYLWKRAGAKPVTGSFSDLLEAGQKSVFERPASARLFSLVRDAAVKVSERGETLIITISGRKNVARLFDGKPPEVTFKITVPGDDPKQETVPVRYED